MASIKTSHHYEVDFTFRLYKFRLDLPVELIILILIMVIIIIFQTFLEIIAVDCGVLIPFYRRKLKPCKG